MALLIVVSVVAGYVVNRWWIVFVIAGAMSADSLVSHNTGIRLIATGVLGGGLAALGVYSRRRPSMFRRHAQTVAARANKDNIVEIVKEQRDLAVERVAPAEMREAIKKTTSEAVERVAPAERREAIRKTTSDAVGRVTTPGMRDAVRNSADAAKTKMLSPELRESIGRTAQQAITKAKSPEVRDAIERGKQQAISTAKNPQTLNAVEKGAGQMIRAVPNPMLRTLLQKGHQEFGSYRPKGPTASVATPPAEPAAKRPDPRDEF